MKLNIYNNSVVVEVVLSRRNLETLLLKLDEPTSAKTLEIASNGRLLRVRAETNEVHYAEREPAGLMHPREESRLS